MRANVIGAAASAKGVRLLTSVYEQEVSYATATTKIWIICQYGSVFVGAASYDQTRADAAAAEAGDLVRAVIRVPVPL